MIRKLTGRVASTTVQSLILDVHGVGYFVSMPQVPQVKLGDDLSIFTYLAVRENALDLYGFNSADELEIFEQLLTLPKIGPKSALQILTQASIEIIKTAVLNNDPVQLSKMTGMGKKTAEKVVSGLTELYEKLGIIITSDVSATNTPRHLLSDTIDALIALGYPEHDARKTVQQISESKPELQNTNDILKEALRSLS